MKHGNGNFLSANGLRNRLGYVRCLSLVILLLLGGGSAQAFTGIALHWEILGWTYTGNNSFNFLTLTVNGTTYGSIDPRGGLSGWISNLTMSASPTVGAKLTWPAGGSAGPPTLISTADQFATANGQTMYVSLTWGGGANQAQAGPPQTNCVTRTISNGRDYCMTYVLYKLSDSVIKSSITLQPGQSGDLSFCDTGAPYPMGGIEYPCDGDPAHPSYYLHYTTNGLGWDTNAFAGGQAPVTPNGTAASTNLGFSGSGSQLALDSTSREGFSALRDSIVTGNERLGAQVGTLKGAVESGNANVLAAVNTAANNQATAALQAAGNTTLGNIKTDTASIAGNAATAVTKLGSIDTSTALVKTGIDAVNTKLTSVDNNIAGQSANLASIKTATEGTKANLDDLKVTATYMRTAAESTATQVGKLTDITTYLNYTKIATEASASTLLDIKSTGIASDGKLGDIFDELQAAGDGAGEYGVATTNMLASIGQRQNTQIEDFRAFTNVFKVAHNASDYSDVIASGQASAETAFASLGSGIDALQSGLGTAPSTLTSPGDVFTFSIAGRTFNADPLSQ